MGAESDENNGVGVFVEPYQEQVILHVTFHVTVIISGKQMWPEFSRDLLPSFKVAQNIFQCV